MGVVFLFPTAILLVSSLIESEGTVSVHTFSLSAAPPADGLTVSVSTDSLDDFDLDAIEVTGGTIAEVRDDSFDLTITEREATIGLPILEDGTNESSETATFTLEPSDSYEINQAATFASFTLVDNPGQVSVPEEVESNSTLTEANALGLSSDSPSVSINGLIAESFIDLPEDVNFYSFNLDAGQTVSLDVDTEESLANGVVNFRPVVFPELSDILQTFTDFTRYEDVIGLAGLGIGFADVSITAVESDALISANDSSLAILRGVDATVLSESDFAFV